ncbi:glyoxylate/hydroxypyruvate reductase A [Algoriphagus ratkowskyi]|uniref:Glyoxylate/hydroxypyruvate reductase A n=1 Tax=Algoriphagus ratkowskyi TaxID=57028 RepID=A0A2W7S2A7_9BACT|nr:glyoxylate/hydroxypyruvate reductase A [Algoriphagus ratkowskyi]PZX61049.1 glyoxylate/hydroxypyruvate reductase A [Algoriphagus ratkowskyi]TXD79185.1 glyoxylate/hydroxypyruvate reductase A [Algoriphagus ratkowskyi]
MSLAIISPGKNPDVWIKEFRTLAPDLVIEIYPQITEPDKVEYAFLWQHPEGILSDFPNLKMISSMGAGVDHILRDKSIPSHIPIVRIVDDKLTFSMTNYVVMAVLNYHRRFPRFQMNQTRKVWDMSYPEIDVTVGVMGVGALGKDVMDKLNNMGFPVVGFGFSDKTDFEYPYYTKDRLDEFLKEVNVLVCLLPLTPDTENILNLALFEKCNPNTYLINVARGKHLVDDDLTIALEQGLLSGAMLDVYREEPLPKDHPFWENWKITMTPHIASVTNPEAAAPQVIENIKRSRENKELVNVVNRTKGY